MKKSLFFTIALLCTIVQGTWAQTMVKNENELAQAVKTDGATIVMQADIELSQPITIQGNNGASVSVTINMNGKTLTDKTTVGQTTAGCIFIVPTGSTLNLSNGTIADVSNITGNNTLYTAGAIVNNGTTTLSGVTISGCKGLLGGAVKNNKGAKLNLNSCTFDSNEARTKDGFDSGNGGAIWNLGTLVLFDTKFQDCKAVNGAAIYNDASNDASGSISMGDNNSTTSFFSNKASGDGGAIYNLGTLNMGATTFSTNIASGQAGAIWNSGILTLKGCDLLLNQGNTAGAIYLASNGNGNVSVKGGSFKKNKANTNGGAIYCQYTMNLDGVTFEDNKAQNGDGGACYVSTTGNVTLTDENAVGNAYSKNTASDKGGAFYVTGKLTLAGVQATGNSAGDGGFLYIDANGSAVVNTNISITENTATTLGGAIYDAGTLSMQGKISVKNNTAANSQVNNVYLASGKVITVAGAFNASSIGIYLEDVEGTFTSGYSTNNSSTTPDKVFSADYLEEFYCVALSGNEAAIALQNPIVITEESQLRRALDMFPNVNFQLANDINITNSTLVIPTDYTVSIDLNGKTMNRGLTSREWNTGGQVITVREGATLNLSNGTLTGGWGGNSGGLVNEGGTATLTDVTITGCTGDDRGGGISNSAGGTLTMKGGSITGNISNDKTTPEGGGGIFNAEGATMFLEGVSITSNQAKEKGGGGICNFGTLTIDGCTITGNSCGKNGGGIYSASAATLIVLNKNTVTDNTGKDGVTHNVFLKENAVFTVKSNIEGSKIGLTLEDDLGVFTTGFKKNHPEGNVDPTTIFIPDEDNMFDVALNGDEVAMIVQPLIVVDNDPDLRRAASFDGANIQLAADIQMSNSTLVIGGGKTVTIDLNGKTLDRGLTSRDFDHGGQVITVRNGGTLNLTGGTLTGGYGGNGGGLVNEGGTAILTNVNITGCTADQRGGGISNYGTLTVTGGSITGNTSNDIKASSSDVTGGGAIFTSSGSTTTITGVTITGNQAKGAGGGGVNNWGTATIDGCTITGNTCKTNGGGVWSSSSSTLNMQGKNTITDNQGNGNTCNVYLSEGAVITVTGSLADSQIGISMQKPGTFTSGYSTNNADVAPIQIFLSDDVNYKVILNNNEAKLVKGMTGIEAIDNGQLTIDNSWYDMNGRKLNAKPSRAGVYINNGNKVVIK